MADGLYEFTATASTGNTASANAKVLGTQGRLKSVIMVNQASFAPLNDVRILLSHDNDPTKVVSYYSLLDPFDGGTGQWYGDIPVLATDTLTVLYFSDVSTSIWRVYWRIEP